MVDRCTVRVGVAPAAVRAAIEAWVHARPMTTGRLLQLRSHARVEALSDDGLAAACAVGDRIAQGPLFERHVDVDLEGQRGTEVAAALGLPDGTVWRRLSDARAQLRALPGAEP